MPDFVDCCHPKRKASRTMLAESTAMPTQPEGRDRAPAKEAVAGARRKAAYAASGRPGSACKRALCSDSGRSREPETAIKIGPMRASMRTQAARTPTTISEARIRDRSGLDEVCSLSVIESFRLTNCGSAAAAPRTSEYRSGGRRASITDWRPPAVRRCTATKAGRPSAATAC